MNKAGRSKRSARPLVESLTTVMPHLALVSKAKLRRLLREMRCRITLSGYGKNAASAGRARHRAAQQPHARCALEFTPPCGFRSLRPDTKRLLAILCRAAGQCRYANVIVLTIAF
jgi:hypothetical protein